MSLSPGACTNLIWCAFSTPVEFIKSVARYYFPAGATSSPTRMGLVVYSSQVNVAFHLNAYTTRDQILCALDGVTRVPELTQTGRAFNVVRTQMLQTAK